MTDVGRVTLYPSHTHKVHVCARARVVVVVVVVVVVPFASSMCVGVSLIWGNKTRQVMVCTRSGLLQTSNVKFYHLPSVSPCSRRVGSRGAS